MNGPNDLDDGWAELARELGLEGQTPAPAPTSRRDDAPPSHDEAEELVEIPADEPEADEVEADDFDAGAEPDGEPEGEEDSAGEGEEAEGEGEGEATPGEPGEPKKKRRRRRRRGKKKPGEAAEPVALVPADGESEEADEPEAEDESADSEEGEPTADEGLVEEEGATPAATRELIANWDVPSWETIVTTMLFRPPGNR